VEGNNGFSLEFSPQKLPINLPNVSEMYESLITPRLRLDTMNEIHARNHSHSFNETGHLFSCVALQYILFSLRDTKWNIPTQLQSLNSRCESPRCPLCILTEMNLGQLCRPQWQHQSQPPNVDVHPHPEISQLTPKNCIKAFAALSILASRVSTSIDERPRPRTYPTLYSQTRVT
jgi:hypothetical protein